MPPNLAEWLVSPLPNTTLAPSHLDTLTARALPTLHVHQISSAYRAASTMPATIVNSHTCVLLSVAVPPNNSLEANDLRPRGVHEARLAPCAACERAKERAGDDPTCGAVCCQLMNVGSTQLLATH